MKPQSGILRLEGIGIDVIRKDVIRIRISVHPPDGRVRVSAPRRTSDAELVRILQPRLAWIIRKQAEVVARHAGPRLEFVTGERHAFWGREYPLRVIEVSGRPAVALIGDLIEMRVATGSTAEQRAAVLERWYRRELGKSLEPFVADWARRMDLALPEVRITRMKTRWGSCNVRARRIWLNLELVKWPSECLEYVVVHELAHLIEPGHGARFWALMDEHLPGWRAQRRALKGEPSS